MKAVVVFKEDSEQARPVLEYLRDFEHQTGRTLETVDPDSVEGADMCRVYDIVEYPTIVAMSDEGMALNSWRGLPLPTISEVSYYV